MVKVRVRIPLLLKKAFEISLASSSLPTIEETLLQKLLCNWAIWFTR